MPGARWSLAEGRLTLAWNGVHAVEAVPRPAPAQVAEARRLLGPAKSRQGWFLPRGATLWMDLGEGRWLQVDGVNESQAFKLLDTLEVTVSGSVKRAA